MATLRNDIDTILQNSPYRDKSTAVTVSATNTNFILAKNGGPIGPASTTLTASPNIVFTNAAVYSWYYALNTAPTVYKALAGSLVQGKTIFAVYSGLSISGTGTYTGVTVSSTSGSGVGAVLTIQKASSGTTSYSAISVTVTNPGTGYQLQDNIVIPGNLIGGTTPTNDLMLIIGGAVSTLTGITQTITGTTIKQLVGLTNATSLQFKCSVEEPLLDTALAYATIAYSIEQANSDSINIELSKTATSISLNTEGVGSFSDTGTSITVTRGGAALVYSTNGGSTIATSSANSFTVEVVQDPLIDTTVSYRTISTSSIDPTNTKYIFNGITTLTQDYATVTFRVMIYDASGNKTQTTLKQIQYGRVSSGIPATIYFLEATAPVITKSTASVNEPGQFFNISITGKRTIASVTTDFGFITLTGDVTGATESGTAIASPFTVGTAGGGYTFNIPTDAKDTKFTARLYSAASRGDSQTVLLDTQVFPVVFTGGNSVVCALTNESVSVPVNIAGDAITGSYNNTGTLIRVYEGTTELTYVTGTEVTQNGTWVVAVTPQAGTGVSLGTTTSVSQQKYASQANILGMTAARTSTITYVVTGKTQGGKDFTFTKVQSINKSYPGVDAVLTWLDIATPIVTKTSNSADIEGTHTNITVIGRTAVGETLPVNYGYVTVSPNVKINSISTEGNISCTGTGMFTVDNPIVFTGIIPATGIVAGTVYYIKSISSNVITISATLNGTLKTFTANSTAQTAIYAYSENPTATAISITTTIPNNAGIFSLFAKMYSAADRTANTTQLLDSQEIVVLFKAANAINGVLSNDSVSIPCTQNADGSVITPISGAYNITGTTIRVYEGATELEYHPTSSTTLGRWTISSVTPSKTANVNDITAGAISASGIFAVTAYADNIKVNTASIEYTISGKSLSGASFTITKRQTFSRAVSGKPGVDAINYRVAILTAYAWSNTGSAPTYTGLFNYDWVNGVNGTLSNNSGTQATGTNAGYPTGAQSDVGYPNTWKSVAPAPPSPSNGYTLYQLYLTINAPTTTNNSYALDWATAKLGRLGYTEKGDIGFTGDKSRVIYLVSSSSTPPLTPSATTGDNSIPTSASGTWSYAPTALLNDGQFMYQSDGTFVQTGTSTGTITWRAPYLSNLKVGSLSAISANLGSVTSGSLNIGSGRFIVDGSGNVSIKGAGTYGMEINSQVIKIFDSTTGALRVQLGNLDI